MSDHYAKDVADAKTRAAEPRLDDQAQIAIDDVDKLAPWSLCSHTSEPDALGPPDVGLTITLPGGAVLWAGEITRDAYEGEGEAAAELGSDGGTWIILYPPGGRDSIVVGKALSQDAGYALIHAIWDSVNPPAVESAHA